MNPSILVFVLCIKYVLTTVVIDQIMPETRHYCEINDPIHSYSFNFLGLTEPTKDNLIRIAGNEFLKVHFCRTLVKPCNGTEGYAVCLNKSNGQEVGVGKEPPEVDITSGKIKFKYTGDACNKTHNYTVNFEMKCDFSMGNQTAIDMDIVHDHNQCDFHMYVETIAACTNRKQMECFINARSGFYNLSSLTDLSNNYEVQINDNLTVILNICHSLIFGEHYSACGPDAAVCLINKTDHLNIRYKNLGNVDENSKIKVIGGNLQIEYKNGSFCDTEHFNAIEEIQSTVTFICDLNAINSLPEYNGGLEFCNLKFVWKTIAACNEQILYNRSLMSRKFCAVKDPITNFEYDLSILQDKPYKIRKMDEEYEFNVCGPSMSRLCKPGTGVCKIVDGQTYGISGGIANANLLWREEGPYLNYTNGNSCGNGRQKFTVISFFCGERDTSDIEEMPCYTTINMTTTLICRQACATFDNNVNLQQLIHSSDNYIIKGNNTEYHMNVCQPVIPKYLSNCPRGAGICKSIVDKTGNLTNEINLGYPDQHPHVSSNGIVTLTYKNGSVCEEDASQKISSQISFLCNFHINEGAPQFKSYNNCIYYFEWKTKVSCGKVDSNINKNCELTNSLGDFWDFTTLNQIMENDEYKMYNISICGENRICKNSYVCDANMSYGRKLNILYDYANNIITFEFSDGSKCWDGTRAQSMLTIKCNESATVGRPILVLRQFCTLEFEWVTNFICKPQKQLSIPPSRISVGQIIAILLLIILIIIAYLYFQNSSRRAHFLMCVHHFILKYNLCCTDIHQPTENLCI